MSLLASILNLFRNRDPRKSSDRNDEAHINRAPKIKPTLSPSFSRLARSSLTRHSKASKANTQRSIESTANKTSPTYDHGEIGSQASQTPTDSVTGHSGPSPSTQRPRALSTISSISHQSIQTIVYSPSPTQNLENAIASLSTSNAPSSHNTSSSHPSSNHRPSSSSIDSIDAYNAELAEKRALFENPSPATRAQRREALYELPHELYMTAAKWFHEHPEDLWATDAEQEANFTRMALDGKIEMAAQDDVEGLKNHDGVEYLRGHPDYEKICMRAEKVGWYRVAQESVFRKEWCGEGGMFGKKGGGGVLLEEVGPMGETL